MTMGKGSLFSTTYKQKINVRSSTESELIGINKVAEQIVCTRNFINEHMIYHHYLYCMSRQQMCNAPEGGQNSIIKQEN